MAKSLSIIIPVLNEEPNLVRLYSAIKQTLSRSSIKDYEIIFVDDGSTDGSYGVLVSLKKNDSRIKIIVFQKHFGKSAALNAGFAESKNEIVITMDGDLQDDASEIPRFIAKMEEGYDMVSGWKQKRHDPISKTIPSKFFNWLAAKMTHVRIHDFNCGFKAYRKEVVKSINVYGELHRYIPALAAKKGFEIGEITVNHHKRQFGKSKFGTGRLFRGMVDMITVTFIMNYSKRPLHFFAIPGFISFFIGILGGLYLLALKLSGELIGDRPLLMLVVLLIVIGMQFISLGLIGELTTRNDKDNDYVIREII